MQARFNFRQDVPGQYGDGTILDDRFYPSKIYHLEFIFDRNPDDIFGSGRVFVVSRKLFDKIIDIELTGLNNPRLITYQMSKQYKIISANEELTKEDYYMIDIIGNHTDDFQVINEPNFKFIVSERALNLLKTFKIKFAEWEDYYSSLLI